MSNLAEHKKAWVIWCLRRDLQAFQEFCLKSDHQDLSSDALRVLLRGVNAHYENLEKRLQGPS